MISTTPESRLKDFEELMNPSPSSPFCVFTYFRSNVGDHIQTLALLQHVKHNCLVPRDHLTPHKDLVLLANGWLSHGELPNRDDFRDVKYVGVHLHPKQRTAENIRKMRDCGVIGCRDPATEAYLKSQGVPTYLTRCATLTFPRYCGKREGVYCVDLFPELADKVRGYYRDATHLSHHLPDRKVHEVSENEMQGQFQVAYDYLLKYMQAELVITTRVHAALPCAAFGTPVIYVGIPRKMDDRVSLLDGIGIKSVDRSLRWLPSWAMRKPRPIDTTRFRERYIGFLKQSMAQWSKG